MFDTYGFKEIQGRCYVIHDQTGCSLIYHARMRRYNLVVIPEYKREYFNTWLSYSNNKRSVMRKKSKELKNSFPCVNVVSDISDFDFDKVILSETVTLQDYHPEDQILTGCGKIYKKKAEEEKNMYFADKNEDTKKNHLMSRLSSIYYDKVPELRKAFNMDVDEPTSPKDIAERLKAGKYTVRKADKDVDDIDVWNFYWRDYFSWEDPANPADTKGFDAAMDKLQDAHTKTKDTIIVMDEVAGLAALREFEAATFH